MFLRHWVLAAALPFAVVSGNTTLHAAAPQGAALDVSKAADFIGTWKVTAYGDLHISDPPETPVAITAYPLDISIAELTSVEGDVRLNVSAGAGTLQAPLINCPSCRAATARDEPIASWPEMGDNLLDAVVMAKGNLMVLALVGQDPLDPANTGFLYAGWQKTPTPITREDFYGRWPAKGGFEGGFEDPNIRNAEGERLEFSSDAGWFLVIGPGGSTDTITADFYFGDETNLVDSLELRVNGFRAFLPKPKTAFGGIVQSFDLYHGGEIMGMANAVQETFDLSDVSLSIGLASKQDKGSAPFNAAVLQLLLD